jgi:hypothetical protein
MANDRMYLVNKKSGVGVALGKHMGLEWYSPPSAHDLNTAYKLSFSLGGGYDFCVVCEGDLNSRLEPYNKMSHVFTFEAEEG